MKTRPGPSEYLGVGYLHPSSVLCSMPVVELYSMGLVAVRTAFCGSQHRPTTSKRRYLENAIKLKPLQLILGMRCAIIQKIRQELPGTFHLCRRHAASNESNEGSRYFMRANLIRHLLAAKTHVKRICRKLHADARNGRQDLSAGAPATEYRVDKSRGAYWYHKARRSPLEPPCRTQ